MSPDLPNFAATLPARSSWEWNFGQAPAFKPSAGRNVLQGGVELHLETSKRPYPRTQVFTGQRLNLAPLALAARLQGCLYRADNMLQQECEALFVDFPGAGERA